MRAESRAGPREGIAFRRRINLGCAFSRRHKRRDANDLAVTNDPHSRCLKKTTIARVKASAEETPAKRYVKLTAAFRATGNAATTKSAVARAIRRKTAARRWGFANRARARHMARSSRSGNSLGSAKLAADTPGFRLHKRRRKNSEFARRMAGVRRGNYSDRFASEWYTAVQGRTADFSRQLGANNRKRDPAHTCRARPRAFSA